MRPMFIFPVIFSLFVYSCNNTSNQSAGWRGSDRNGIVENFDVPDSWPAELKPVWTETVGFCDASPVLAGNRIFLHVKQNDDEVTLCLDSETGSEIWRTINNKAPEVTGGARPHPGPRSTPCVAGGKVFTLGVGGALNCMDAKTGNVIWSNNEYTEVPDFFAAMSPLVDDGVCYVHLGGRETGAIVAFNADTGERIWELKGHPATYSSPVIFKAGKEKILVVQTETHLLGISMEGNLLWQEPTPAERRFYNSSTPVIDGQNIVVAGQGLGTRSFKVEKTEKGYQLKENWLNPEFGGSFNTPVLKSGYLYGHEARLGKIYCLNALTGETCWSDTTAHNRFASNLDLGKVMLSLTGNGKMVVYEPSPEKYVEKAEYVVSASNIYAHPIVAGNRIYTKDQENLTCWAVN